MTTSNLFLDFFSQVKAAELALLKAPLLVFADALKTPGANVLTIQNAAANFALQIPQLTGPAQGAAINLLGTGLSTWINSLTPPAA